MLFRLDGHFRLCTNQNYNGVGLLSIAFFHLYNGAVYQGVLVQTWNPHEKKVIRSSVSG